MSVMTLQTVHQTAEANEEQGSQKAEGGCTGPYSCARTKAHTKEDREAACKEATEPEEGSRLFLCCFRRQRRK
jgi:hypothetical protein